MDKFLRLYEKDKDGMTQEYIDNLQIDFCKKYGISKTFTVSVFGTVKSKLNIHKMKAYQIKREQNIKQALGNYSREELKMIYESMRLQEFVTMYGKHDRFWKDLFGPKPLKLVPYTPEKKEAPKEVNWGEPMGYKPFIKLPLTVGRLS